jgi:membrane associated rhomboid family serine protease
MIKGKGRELGLQLRAWLEAGAAGLDSGQAIGNRLVDALGADETLKGPVRDLASQRLLLQVLRQSGASQRSALASLSQQLSQTYSPAVWNELQDLLEAATGVVLPRPELAAPRPLAVEPGAEQVVAQKAIAERSLALRPQDFGPGLALAAGAALVFGWLGQELDRALFERWGWSGGVVLVVVLGLLQALAIGPLKGLRRRWILNDQWATEPRQAWRWISAPWLHASGLEAGVNLVALLILLGPSPLQLGDVVLRYCLVSLATLVLAASMARRFGVIRTWSGSSGAISGLIALAASLSLLHWREHSFTAAGVAIPAWVLLLVYGALQLGWQLPRQDPTDSSQPLQRLLSCQWWWGLVLGALWALISWGQELLGRGQ